jgi:hypothetical protein
LIGRIARAKVRRWLQQQCQQRDKTTANRQVRSAQRKASMFRRADVDSLP